eukprot:scaffold12789_cov74-Skeletonema_menzelii.AAC.1
MGPVQKRPRPGGRHANDLHPNFMRHQSTFASKFKSIQASSKLELYRKSEGPQSRIFVTYFGPCRKELATAGQANGSLADARLAAARIPTLIYRR